MIKIDNVYVNRLEQLTKIELDNYERGKLGLEIIQALEFIGTIDQIDDCKSNQWFCNTLEIVQLRNDEVKKPLFDFFRNVPEQFEDYVVV